MSFKGQKRYYLIINGKPEKEKEEAIVVIPIFHWRTPRRNMCGFAYSLFFIPSKHTKEFAKVMDFVSADGYNINYHTWQYTAHCHRDYRTWLPHIAIITLYMTKTCCHHHYPTWLPHVAIMTTAHDYLTLPSWPQHMTKTRYHHHYPTWLPHVAIMTAAHDYHALNCSKIMVA